MQGLHQGKQEDKDGSCDVVQHCLNVPVERVRVNAKADRHLRHKDHEEAEILE